MNVNAELKRLNGLSVPELRSEYTQLFSEATYSSNKRHLIRRVIWKLQAQAEGDLSQRARRRALELASISDLRLAPPRSMKTEVPFRPKRDPRLPMAGTILTRVFQGKTIKVTTLENGFEWKGTVYRSLSAVAKAVTGRHWNGYHFFQLGSKEGSGNG